MFHERLFRDVSHELCRIIDHRLRHAPHLVLLREIHEFADLDNISNDPGIGNRHFVRQPGDTGTVWSAGGNEHLEMEIFPQFIQHLDRVLG